MQRSQHRKKSLIIALKEWQKSLVLELLGRLQTSVRNAIESSVHELIYIEKKTGDGFYCNHVAGISRGIRHPRLLLERTCHEWGHGIEEWLKSQEVKAEGWNPEDLADGFAISILYPEMLSRDNWRPVGKIYEAALYSCGYPQVDTEGLIKKYTVDVKALSIKIKNTLGEEVHNRLEEFFQAQQKGFLRVRSGPNYRFSTP